MTENHTYTTSQGNKISVTAYGTENLISKPCIIISHGFKGFKDWGFFPYSAEYFAQKGCFVLTFNFSHNGIGKQMTDFTELDMFAQNTFSLELEELNEIIFAYKNGWFGNTTNSRICLIGHSRGGAISLLTAVKNEFISCVATWASVANLDRYSERQKEEWRQKGYFAVLNTRTNQEMRLNVTLLNDLEENAEDKLNILKAVSNLKIPFFINHGREDLAVKYTEAEELYNHSNKNNSELNLISNTGHTFGCVHPFSGTNEKFDKLLVRTNSFFEKNLGIK